MDDGTFLRLVCGENDEADDETCIRDSSREGTWQSDASLSSALARLDGDGSEKNVFYRRYLSRLDDLDDFVPSCEDRCYWLQCNAEDYPKWSESWSSKMICQPQLYKGKTQSELNHDKLLEVAVACGLVSGKWNMKATQQHADELWRLLATKVRDGTFGKVARTCIKCSSRRHASQNSSNIYTLCLYIADGLVDQAKVMRIRRLLHEELDVDSKCVQPLYFKPDLYTLLPTTGCTYRWIDGIDTEYQWSPHFYTKPLLTTL